MKWSKKTMLNFIKDYKANTVLWDKQLPDYSNNDLRKTILLTLAKKYNCGIDHIKVKINSLRKLFKEENIKMKKTGITSKWYGYRAMSFVQDQLSSRIWVNYNWSQKTVLSLIKDYRANPCLWHYRGRTGFSRNLCQVEAVLLKLAKKYNRSVRDIKIKLRAFRECFRLQHEKSRRLGEPSKWFAYQPLSFLSTVYDGSSHLQEDGEGNNNWSQETVLNLIEDYRANPCLWGYRGRGGFSRNFCQKEAILLKLVKKYNRDVRDIKMKLTALRNNFKTEHDKSTRLGEPSKWYAYKPLSFLLTVYDGSLQLEEDDEVNRNWSQQTVLSLIKDYRANPCLWDYSVHGGHKNISQKEVLWSKLAKKYNRDVRDIRMKLKKLRQGFRIQREKSRRLGEPSKWFAYQPLSFLSIVYDGSSHLQEDGEKNPSEKNGNNDVIESRPPSSNLLNDMSMDSSGIESDSEDSEQSMECLSERTSISESTDQITNEPEPSNKIYASKQPAKYNSVKQMNYSEEDLKFWESLLPHIRNIPENKKLHFRNKVQELVQMFAYSDSSENNAQPPMKRMEPDSPSVP